MNAALRKTLIHIVNANGTKADSCYLVDCRRLLKAQALLLEAKNEIGVGGSDPSIEASFSYREFWSEDGVGCFLDLSACSC
jgi:hypothetical protein